MSETASRLVPPAESTKTLAQCLELISHMGSCYAVAHYLHDLGFKGFRYQSDDTAFARWIRWETGAARCEIDPWEIGVLYDTDKAAYEHTPSLVVEFERRFDRGEFPALIQTGVRT